MKHSQPSLGMLLYSSNGSHAAMMAFITKWCSENEKTSLASVSRGGIQITHFKVAFCLLTTGAWNKAVHLSEWEKTINGLQKKSVQTVLRTVRVPLDNGIYRHVAAICNWIQRFIIKLQTLFWQARRGFLEQWIQKWEWMHEVEIMFLDTPYFKLNRPRSPYLFQMGLQFGSSTSSKQKHNW